MGTSKFARLWPGTEIHIAVLVAGQLELFGRESRQGWKKWWRCARKRRQCWPLSCRLVMFREAHGLGCPSQAGLKAECNRMCLDMGSWAGPVCVVEMQKRTEREEKYFCLSHSFEGCWWGTWAVLDAVSLGLERKRVFSAQVPSRKACQPGPELSGSKAEGEPKSERFSWTGGRKGRKPHQLLRERGVRRWQMPGTALRTVGYESVSECKDGLDAAGPLSTQPHELLCAGAFQGEAKK